MSVACDEKKCLHGGTCDTHDFGCHCPYEFNGPSCQQLLQGFENNRSAIYAPLPNYTSSSKLHIALEFIVKSDIVNGTILFSGPKEKREIHSDAILIIKLVNGKPQVEICSETRNVTLSLESINALADGKWHRIDLVLEDQVAKLIVDLCNDTPCFISQSLSSISALQLNEYPLQLGGRKPLIVDELPSNNFASMHSPSGLCIRNLRVNGEFYDLHIDDTNSDKENYVNRCISRDVACGISENDLYGSCGSNGFCHSKSLQMQLGSTDCQCICKVPYRPINVEYTNANTCNTKCDILTRAISLNDRKSYIRWNLSDGLTNKVNDAYNKVEFSFRTFALEGTLMVLKSNSASMHTLYKFSLDTGRLVISYQLKAGKGHKNEIRFPLLRPLSDGIWHRIVFIRSSSNIEVSVDGGSHGGYYFNGNAHDIRIKFNNFLAIGSDFEGIHPKENTSLSESSCFKDIRISNFNIPLSNTHDDLFAGIIEDFVDIENYCSSQDACQSNPCPAEKPVCLNRWRSFTCDCRQEDVLMENGTCVPYDGCIMEGLTVQCKNNAICNWNVLTKSIDCQCTSDWQGKWCDIRAPVLLPSLTSISTIPWHYILIFGAALIVILIIVLTILRNLPNRKYEQEPDSWLTEYAYIQQISGSFVNYCENGGGKIKQQQQFCYIV